MVAVGGLLLSGARAPEAQTTGTITGQVTTSAQGASAPLPVTTDHDVCGQSVPDESIVVGATGGLAQATVTLSGTRSAGGGETTVTNLGCRFEPHVQIVAPGTALQVTSQDSTLHTTHAYLDEEETLFNIAIPVPGLTITRQLVRPGRVSLKCDTHPWMIGHILVTDEIGAVTDAEGRFSLEGVPAGSYELAVWHETLGMSSQQVTVTAGESSDVAISLNP